MFEMKKTYIPGSTAHAPATLYAGITAIAGGCLLTSGGSFFTLHDLYASYDAGDLAVWPFLTAIKQILTDPTAPWEKLDESEKDDIRDWLNFDRY